MYLRRSFKQFLFLILLIFSITLKSAVIIWDIGDTLLTRSSSKYLSLLGKKEMTKFYFHNLAEGKSGSFFHRMFNFGDDIKFFYLNTLSKIASPYQRPDYQMKDPSGIVLPPLLQDLMLGRISAKDAIKIVDKWILDNEKKFKSEKEMNVFSKIFHLNFDPELFMSCNCYTIYMPLLKKAYYQVDKNGKRKNKCIILSNWAKEWIPLMKKQFPEIFKYTDAQIFSCDENCAKPCSKIYKKCLSLFPEKKDEPWILIDDQKENRDAARLQNIKAVHPKKAEKTLRNLRLI